MSACAWPVYVGLKTAKITHQYVNADGQLVTVYDDGTEVRADGFAESMNPAIDARIDEALEPIEDRLEALETSAFENPIGA